MNDLDERNTLIPSQSAPSLMARRKTLKVLGLAAGGLLVFPACKEAAKPSPPAAAPPPVVKPPEVAAKPPEPAAAPAGEPPATNAVGDLNCKEKAAIDETSKGLRRALQYKEKSAEAGKNCKGCAQFEAGKYGDCGACKLFTGAVNPEGHCLSFAPKAG